MPDLDSLAEQLATAAGQPAEAQSDAGRVRQHSLADQIAAHRYLRSVEAADGMAALGIRLVKLIPPGTD